MPRFPLHYSGGRLDRAATFRRDEAWVAEMLGRPDARVVPVWRDRSLVCQSDASRPTVRAVRLGVNDLREHMGVAGATPHLSTVATDTSGWVLLGLNEGVPVLAVDISDIAEDDAAALAANGGTGASFEDLRRVGGATPMEDAALMAYARGMLTWHRRQRFCGNCGSATRSAEGGHMLVCTNLACSVHTFPRTDPAVIMLVERSADDDGPARCLLARHARFKRSTHSTLAGFVEPGESLEEAVAREVMEETGVRVGAVSYHGSQPWPFPSSLMVGFRAQALSRDIRIDPQEIDDARWFSAADLDAFGEWEDDGVEFRLPRRDSIARSLVEAWRTEQR